MQEKITFVTAMIYFFNETEMGLAPFQLIKVFVNAHAPIQRTRKENYIKCLAGEAVIELLFIYFMYYEHVNESHYFY